MVTYTDADNFFNIYRLVLTYVGFGTKRQRKCAKGGTSWVPSIRTPGTTTLRRGG